MSKAETHYCVTCRELLAVVTFTRHFHPYLVGQCILLRTDHGSLTWLQNFREPECQLEHWLEQLQALRWSTEGARNTPMLIDALSAMWQGWPPFDIGYFGYLRAGTTDSWCVECPRRTAGRCYPGIDIMRQGSMPEAQCSW